MDTMEELVSRVINGDMAAFEELYQRTSKQVYYTCMSFVKNEQDVFDVMQDTYLSALTHLHELNNPDRFPQWLNQIAVNRCKNLLMKKQPLFMEDENLESQPLEENDNFLPENYVTNKEKRELVLKIMREELSVVQYQTIILYYFDGLSVQEIADSMQCPTGTVTYRLSTARAKIKAGVEKYENTSGEKLYASALIPFLTALLTAETEGLIVPNVLATITASIAGTVGITAGASSTGTSGSATVGTQATGTASAVVSGQAAAATAAKTGVSALFATIKAKIIISVIAVAAVATGIALFVANKKPEPKVVYTSDNITVVYNSVEYKPEDGYNGTLYINCTVTNHTDELLLVHRYFVESNGLTDYTYNTPFFSPGDNEVTFELPLISTTDTGTIELSSATILLYIETNGDNDFVEGALFSCDFDETIQADVVYYYEVDDFETVYSDDSIEIRLEKICRRSGPDSAFINQYLYVYNKTDEPITVELSNQSPEHPEFSYIGSLIDILPHGYSLGIMTINQKELNNSPLDLDVQGFVRTLGKSGIEEEIYVIDHIYTSITYTGEVWTK